VCSSDLAAPATVLVIVAHPDDETMIGGLLGRLDERGIRVTLAVVTNGEAGVVVTDIPPHGDLVERPPGARGTGAVRTATDLARTRRAEAQAAARAYGVDELVFLSEIFSPRFVDDAATGVAAWDRDALAVGLGDLAGRVGPDVVITLDPGGGAPAHPQHTGLGRWVREFHAAGVFDG